MSCYWLLVWAISATWIAAAAVAALAVIAYGWRQEEDQLRKLEELYSIPERRPRPGTR